MLERLVESRLSEGGRLVIPRLGTFFVREDGRIVFSELLRSDDGVLRGLLVSRGVGESEAAGVVDRFVFEIRHTIDHNRPFRIGTLGVLYRDARGLIRFADDSAPGPDAAKGEIPEMQSERRSAEPAPSPAESRPHVRRPRRRGADIILIVAAAALLAAIGVIVYGWFVSNERAGLLFDEPQTPAVTGLTDGSAADTNEQIEE